MPDEPCQTTEAFEMIRYLLADVKVTNVFDVGANEGQTLEQFIDRFPEASIFAFEPFPPCYRKLRKKFGNHPRISIFPEAISSQTGKKRLYVYNYSGVNSLLEMSESINTWADANDIEVSDALEVSTLSIDGFSQMHNVRQIDLLKMDIQGGELMALKGADRMLREKKVMLLLLEVLFTAFYNGQAYFWDIAQYLSGFNYHLVNIYNVQITSSGFLRWADAIFINDALWKMWSSKHSAGKLKE